MNDFLNDEFNDILISGDGDLFFGESDEQHQAHMMAAPPGSFKNTPDGTVGIHRYLMDDDIDGMINDIRAKFDNDGCPVNSINYDADSGDLTYHAPYN